MSKPFDLELTASSLVNIIKNSTGLKTEAKVQEPDWDSDAEQILITVLTPKKNITLGHFTIVESKSSGVQSVQSNFRGIMGTDAMSDVVTNINETLAKYNQLNSNAK